MPLYTPPADIPADLAAVAMDSDAVIEDELAGLIPAPDSPYNARVLTALAKAISDAAKVMGLDLEPITYSEPEVRLEPEVVRMLAMLAAAADDYGQPFPVTLEQIKGDRELTAITAHLLKLAKDKGFADFLDMPSEGEVEVEIKAGPAEVEVAEDFDFAGRMRPRG